MRTSCNTNQAHTHAQHARIHRILAKGNAIENSRWKMLRKLKQTERWGESEAGYVLVVLLCRFVATTSCTCIRKMHHFRIQTLNDWGGQRRRGNGRYCCWRKSAGNPGNASALQLTVLQVWKYRVAVVGVNILAISPLRWRYLAAMHSDAHERRASLLNFGTA